MALSTILRLRLEMMIERLKNGDQINISPGSKLGLPPIGFDDTFLKGEFVLRLNDNEIGFADLLDKPIAKSDVGQDKKVSELVATISEKSHIKTEKQYETKMRERARLGLRTLLGKEKGVTPDSVLPTHKVRDYFNLAQESEAKRLAASINEELRKYLLTRVRPSELDALVSTVEQRIVLHAIA